MTIGAYEFIWTPPMYGEVEWERRWETDLTSAAQGQEEREAKRSVGLKSIRYVAQPITLEETDQLLAAIRTALKSGKAAAPFWGRGVQLAADVTTNTVTLEDNFWGFAIGDFLFLCDQINRLCEVRSITNVVGNVLTLDVNVARTYASGTLCWPVIFGELVCENADLVTNHRAHPRIKISEQLNGVSKVESACPVPVTYLGRPVAQFDVENAWLDSDQSRSFQYDLRKILTGFGAPSYAPIQNNVVNGWELTAVLEGAAAIKGWDCFTGALLGRANGFWLPDVSCLADILSAPAADKVRCTDSDLATVWAADPAVYVVFRKDGQADKFAAITNVTDIGGGIEEITLDAAVSVDATWLMFRLRYVRLVDDIEKAKCPQEGRQYRSIKVVELPEEYVVVETGTQPVWLYTFWIETPGGNTYWRYTSFGQDLNSGGNLFSSANLNHGNIKRSITPESDEVTIEAVRENANVFAFFAPLTLPLNLWVKIEEATAGAPDESTIVFIGIAPRAPMTGKRVSMKVSSVIDALGAESPNVTLQTRCNHRVFSPAPACGLDRNTYKVAVTIASISADRRVIELTGAGLHGNNAVGFDKWQDNYWAWGWIELGAGATYQVATILKSLAVVVSGGNGARIYLGMALQASAIVTGAATVTPGCDGLRGTCVPKFNNYVNFLGMPFMPKGNPAIPAVDSAFRTDVKK